jgi:HSP20 family molecular chaperone IbpA
MKQYPGFAHLFDDFFNSNFGVSQAGLLKTDIREANGNYELNMEVPGFKKEDIHIELSQGYLNIKASRTNTEEEKDESGKLIRQERYSGSCSRSFYIGDGYKEEDIKASFNNGELIITLPTEARKIEETKKMISIE